MRGRLSGGAIALALACVGCSDDAPTEPRLGAGEFAWSHLTAYGSERPTDFPASIEPPAGTSFPMEVGSLLAIVHGIGFQVLLEGPIELRLGDCQEAGDGTFDCDVTVPPFTLELRDEHARPVIDGARLECPEALSGTGSWRAWGLDGTWVDPGVPLILEGAQGGARTRYDIDLVDAQLSTGPDPLWTLSIQATKPGW